MRFARREFAAEERLYLAAQHVVYLNRNFLLASDRQRELRLRVERVRVWARELCGCFEVDVDRYFVAILERTVEVDLLEAERVCTGTELS